MSRLIVHDDQHWTLKDVKTDIGLLPDEERHEYYPADYVTKLTNDFYFKFFYLSKKEQIATRQFMKAQELGAIIGGFVKIVFMNCFLLAQFYGKFYLIIFYLRNLFVPVTRPAIEGKQEEVSINNYTSDSVLPNASKAIKQVKLNIFSYYLRCCRSKKTEQLEALKSYKAAESYIKERLDVKYLMMHFEKFDILCETILSGEQKTILKI